MVSSHSGSSGFAGSGDLSVSGIQMSRPGCSVLDEGAAAVMVAMLASLASRSPRNCPRTHTP